MHRLQKSLHPWREVPAITQLTGVPATIRGVNNIRGSVVPIVDIKKETSIIVTEIKQEGSISLMGILVDAVHEVMLLDENKIEPPPKIGMKMETSCIEGMGKQNEEFIILLKIQDILTKGELAVIEDKLLNI